MAFIFLATSTSGCPSSSILRILAVRAFWMLVLMYLQGWTISSTAAAATAAGAQIYAG